jgi:small GTP-binding protein
LDLSILEIRLDEDFLQNDTLIESILLDCPCALLLIDITKKESLEAIKSFLNNIIISKHPYLKMILLLNKSDLQSEKQIEDSEVKDILEKNNYLDNLEISIKNGTNIPELLNKINEAINDPKKELAANIVAETVEKNVGFMNAEGSLSLILVGDSTVGKTCLLNRYFKNQFKSTISNIGIDKDIKFVKINNIIYKLTVWDTVGQERFRALPKKYYQNADGVLLLFDVTKEESFSNVSTWMKDIKDNSNKESNITIYLIGNKIDLNERAVSKESAEELAQSLGMKYFDVSCKNNINISEIMSRMILECHMKVNKITSCFKIDANNKKGDNKGRKGCC